MTEKPLTIKFADALQQTKVLIELSDGRSIVFTLEQLLTLEPERVVTEEIAPE